MCVFYKPMPETREKIIDTASLQSFARSYSVASLTVTHAISLMPPGTSIHHQRRCPRISPLSKDSTILAYGTVLGSTATAIVFRSMPTMGRLSAHRKFTRYRTAPALIIKGLRSHGRGLSLPTTPHPPPLIPLLVDLPHNMRPSIFLARPQPASFHPLTSTLFL